MLACSGCSPPESTITAAPLAGDPACTSALGRLPGKVLGAGRTALGVAGAASWGNPPIVLRCGLPELPPTARDCLSVDDVDWVVVALGDPVVATTFGRAPAVEVRIPLSAGREAVSAVLVDVAPVARALPKTARSCIG